MRERLEDYVNYLFAGHPEAEDIRQEILRLRMSGEEVVYIIFQPFSHFIPSLPAICP